MNDLNCIPGERKRATKSYYSLGLIIITCFHRGFMGHTPPDIFATLNAHVLKLSHGCAIWQTERKKNHVTTIPELQLMSLDA